MTSRSRVPDIGLDAEHYKFLDTLDKRRLTPIDPVGSGNASAATVSSVTGTASTIATTSSTNTTPYGFTTQAQADSIVSAVNSFAALHAEMKTILNAIVSHGDGGAVALSNETKAQLNALIAEMQTRGAMEKP